MCFSEGWTLLIILLQIALVNQGVMLLRTDQAFTFLDFCKLCESLTKAYLRDSILLPLDSSEHIEIGNLSLVFSSCKD